MSQHPHFVPSGEVRKDTAILLVGTAREFGIDQHDIKSVQGGFLISQSLADVLYAEAETEPKAEPKPKPKASKKASSKTNKTSGDQAVENTGTSRTEQE